MRNIERVIRTACILTIAFEGACSQPIPNVGKSIPSSSPTTGITPETSPTASAILNEKRQRGLALLNLDFEMKPQSKLADEEALPADQLAVSNIAMDYDLIINPQNLPHLASQCRLNRTRLGFHIITVDKIEGLAIPGQSTFLAVPYDNTLKIHIDLGQFYEEAQKELDLNYEVDPDQKTKALDNLVTLNFNSGLVRFLCSYVTSIESRSRTLSPDQLRRVDNEAERVALQLISGEALPTFVIKKRQNSST